MSSEPSQSFWHGALGRRVLEMEQTSLAAQGRRLHGSTALWVGETAVPASLLHNCMVRQGIFLSTSGEALSAAKEATELPRVQGALDALPFAKHQFDGLVLHHALESVADPRAGLREAARVLAPGGRIVIVGFNPVSLFGIRRVYGKWADDVFSQRCFVNPIRLFDWLELLGFSMDAKPSYVDYGLPLAAIKGLEKWTAKFKRRHVLRRGEELIKRLPLGGIVIVSAVKRTIPMTLRPLRRSTRRRLAPAGYPKVVNLRLVKKDDT